MNHLSISDQIKTIIRKYTGRTLSKRAQFPFVAIEKRRFLTIRMDLINRCNLRCKMCYFHMPEVRNLPLKCLSPELFQRIAAEVFPKTRHLIFSAGAEPLMSKHFPLLLEITRRYRLPYISFFTNGMLLNGELARQIVTSGVHEMHVSVDGATKQTYEAIRLGANFEELVVNLRRFQTIKHELHSPTPRLSFQMVLMRSNIAELPAYIALAQELQVANINIAMVVPYKGLSLQDEVPDCASAAVKTALATAQRLAKEANIAFGAPPGILDDKPVSNRHTSPQTCRFPWTELLINPDGSVYPCCFWYENTSMGNFTRQSFRDIWEGYAYSRLRQELLSGHRRSTCATCPLFGSPGSESAPEIEIVRGV